MEEKSKYASQTIDSPSMLKRYSHNIRFSVGKKLLNIDKEDIFLDYGGAEGAFSQTLIDLSPKEIMIYEPPGDMTEGLKKIVLMFVKDLTLIIQWNLTYLK